MNGRERTYEANLTSSDPYEILGVSGGASAREIKRAYFSLVRQYPPESEPEAFKRIRGAYEVLRDPTTRAQTDLFRFQRPSGWTPRKRRKKFNLAFDVADVAHVAENALPERKMADDFRPIEL